MKAKLAGAIAALLLSTTVAAAPVPEVYRSVRNDTSRPLRELLAELPTAPAVDADNPYVVPNLFPKEGSRAQRLPEIDPARGQGVQRSPSGTPAPSTIVSFNGMSLANGGGGVPPDTNGDVSPAHFIQWINTSWAVFDKTTGAIVSGPTPGNSFFAGFGGRCQNDNDGDPLAIWDDRAQRWVMSQFSVPSGSNIGSQCVAISTTSDPLGSYHRYEFQFPLFNDYPHIGIWSDAAKAQSAYLMVTHEFQLVPTQAFNGAAFIAMEREKMLRGEPAAIVRFAGIDAYGAEPAHMEGVVDAPAATCPVFVHFDATTSEYLLWDMCLNWGTPALTSLSPAPIRLAPDNPFVPNFNLVAQPGTTSQLDSFGTHIMYRATARAFPEGAPLRLSMVTNQTVETGGGAAGIRWTQFAFDAGDLVTPADPNVVLRGGFEDTDVPTPRLLTKAIHDEGVYAPDSDVRWMGGIAIDRSGNVGMGYNRSSATTNPKLMVTARTLADSDGTMRDEQFCSPTTTGSQTGLFSGRGRWGDYSSMSIDPVDECTFWFTGEYYPTTSPNQWGTRVCSFRFADCGQPTFDIVSDSPRRVEICGATASDPTFALRVGVLDGFNTPAALSASGFPGGITPQFAPGTINPVPGSSTLTLQGATALASGEYAGTVTATAAAATRSVDLTLGVSATLAPAAVLGTPANGATGVKVRPRLTWAAAVGALSYTVEVATSNTFANIVASDTVTTTQWDVNVGLSASTQYFWRVRANNYCGASTSAVFSFTTGVPGTCPAGTTASIVFDDDFADATPVWTTSGTGGTAWALVTGGAPGITTQAWRVPNNTVTSDRQLTSPNIAVPAGAAAVILSFDAYHSFEIDGATGCWDGAAVEAKLAADTDFTYLDATKIFTNGYNGTVTAGAPLAGREVWCQQPAGNTAQRTVVDLDAYVGQTINLRFRATTDSNTAGPAPNGLFIDNLRVEACQ